MALFDPDAVVAFIAQAGYAAVFLVIALESTGLPLPGEATLVAAAIYASTTHTLSVAGVVAAAAAGAIVGDNIGFWIGRRYGTPLLLRYGGRIGLDEGRLKVGQYLFARYGAAVVIAGRFTALLRATAALLAGANRYPWRSFLIANAVGGIAWAAIYGVSAAAFGRSLHAVSRPVAIGLLAAVVLAIAAVIALLRRHEHRLRAEAERAYPGPLKPTP